MTDHSSLDPQAGPGTGETADEMAVRRLLAGARVDEPMPPVLEARLNSTLASVAARSARPARRRGLALLPVAAAVAVMVTGVGIFEMLSPHETNQSSVSATRAKDPAASQGGASKSKPAPLESSGSASAKIYRQEVATPPSAADQAPGISGATEDDSTSPGLPVIRAAHFVPDAQAALAQPVLTNRSAAPQAPSIAADCAPEVVGEGDRSVVVSFRKAIGRVVLSSDRVLTLYACDGQVVRQRALR